MKAKSLKRAKSKLSGVAAVNAYLARVPRPARAGLQQLRKRIAAVAPHAELGLSYGMPAFKLDGRPLVWFAAFKTHLSFFPGATPIRLYRGQLKNYKISKGTIRFPPEKPLPARLVAKLVKARMAELQPKL